jgi:hypothetical protein
LSAFQFNAWRKHLLLFEARLGGWHRSRSLVGPSEVSDRNSITCKIIHSIFQ